MNATFRPVYGNIKIRTDQREHYHERGERAAREGVVLTVYVPAAGTLEFVNRGSAIVGSPALDSDSVVVHFEGNLYTVASHDFPARVCRQVLEKILCGHSVNMQTFEAKLLHAADRHVTVYPTVAMAHAAERDLTPIGTYDIATHNFTCTNPAALDAWLNPTEEVAP